MSGLALRVHSPLRLAIVVTMALWFSGAPRLAIAALGIEEPDCQTECEGSCGTKHCPPTCTQGACAKVFPTIAPQVAPTLGPPVVARPIHRTQLAVLPAPSVDGVFHPPRA